jgi:hypothetical protein
MHKIKPNQRVRIITIKIAVPASTAVCQVADEISTLLSEFGIGNPESCILDWEYKKTIEKSKIVKSGKNPQENDIFSLKGE